MSSIAKLQIGLCILFLGFISCDNETDEMPNMTGEMMEEMMEEEIDPCEKMFGIPNENTGLSSSFCNPSCECQTFESRTFTAEELATLKSWNLVNPFEEITTNPYDTAFVEGEEAVCAIKIENLADQLYSLATYSDQKAAEAAGAILTHHDACGLCSTLSDFEVYARDRDVGAAVRKCALDNFSSPFEDLLVCIEGLGFTRPCAQIWAYNTRNTQAKCLAECLGATLYHNEDGTLDPCLQCDEDISGPVFKQVAGRTRRNTGLASSICRFCAEVKPVDHDYPF